MRIRISAETVFKAERGKSFGFTFRITGLPEGPTPDFEMRAVHPPMKGPSGSTSSVSTAATEVFTDGGVAENEILYTLSEEFEVLPGQWTLQLLFKGQPVISKRFTLQ
jgi:Domain of unknown function (DUF3859)